MIYELRTYQLAVGQLSNYLELARNTILPALAEHGLEPLGFWCTEVGQLNEVVHLWSYTDLNERQEKTKKWAQDPRSTELKKKFQGVVVSQSNKILLPTEFSLMK